MVERAAPVSTPRMAGSALVALTVGVAITSFAPMRIADCGPADPHLLRYLGSPILHSTGTGYLSSLERHVWAGPFVLNIALVALVVFALIRLSRGMQAAAPMARGVGRAVIWVAALSLVLVLALALGPARVHWQISGPPVTAETCDIRLALRPDTAAWIAP